MPPNVLPPHRRISGGGTQAKAQDYATTPCLRFLCGAAKTDNQKLVAALAVVAWVCFLQVGETAIIELCNVEMAVLTFFRSKPKQQDWHRPPLARYPGLWVQWLYDYAFTHSQP